MTTRIKPGALAILAVAALSAAFAGGAFADKPADPGSKGKGHAKTKAGMKYGVTKVTSGTTRLTLDAGLATTLAGVPVTVSGLPQNPSVAGLPAGAFEFSITKGRVNLKKPNKGRGKKATPKLVSGYVNHSGGIKLERGAAVVTLSDLRINLSAGRTGALDGNVNGAGTRTRIGRLSAVAVDATNKQITATVTLTQGAADTLNGALSLGGMLSKSTVLGVVVVKPASS